MFRTEPVFGEIFPILAYIIVISISYAIILERINYVKAHTERLNGSLRNRLRRRRSESSRRPVDQQRGSKRTGGSTRPRIPPHREQKQRRR